MRSLYETILDVDLDKGTNDIEKININLLRDEYGLYDLELHGSKPYIPDLCITVNKDGEWTPKIMRSKYENNAPLLFELFPMGLDVKNLYFSTEVTIGDVTLQNKMSDLAKHGINISNVEIRSIYELDAFDIKVDHVTLSNTFLHSSPRVDTKYYIPRISKYTDNLTICVNFDEFNWTTPDTQVVSLKTLTGCPIKNLFIPQGGCVFGLQPLPYKKSQKISTFLKRKADINGNRVSIITDDSQWVDIEDNIKTWLKNNPHTNLYLTWGDFDASKKNVKVRYEKIYLAGDKLKVAEV